jgi:hypothetical protein
MHRNAPSRARDVSTIVLAVFLATALPSSARQEELPENVRPVHARLVATAAGRNALSELRIEFMEGGMAAHRSVSIEAGKLAVKAWDAPGSAMVQREGDATDARVSRLLQRLIAAEYWKFGGTRFVPDAPTFLFRFHFEGREYVDFRCDEEEIEASAERRAIRQLFLDFVTETELETISP